MFGVGGGYLEEVFQDAGLGRLQDFFGVGEGEVARVGCEGSDASQVAFGVVGGAAGESDHGARGHQPAEPWEEGGGPGEFGEVSEACEDVAGSFGVGVGLGADGFAVDDFD